MGVSRATSLLVSVQAPIVSQRDEQPFVLFDVGRPGDSAVLHQADTRVASPLKTLYRAYRLDGNGATSGFSSDEEGSQLEDDAATTTAVATRTRPYLGIEVTNRIRQAVWQSVLADQAQQPVAARLRAVVATRSTSSVGGAFNGYHRHGVVLALGLLEAQCRAVQPPTESFAARFLIEVLKEAKAALSVDVAHEVRGSLISTKC